MQHVRIFKLLILAELCSPHKLLYVSTLLSDNTGRFEPDIQWCFLHENQVRGMFTQELEWHKR